MFLYSLFIRLQDDKVDDGPESQAKDLQTAEPEHKAVGVLNVGSVDLIGTHPGVHNGLAGGHRPGGGGYAEDRRQNEADGHEPGLVAGLQDGPVLGHQILLEKFNVNEQ